MAFLFKSKKSQDRTLSSRDGSLGSQGSIQSNSARPIIRDDRPPPQSRGTPTGSTNSVEHDPASPDKGHGRRGGSVDNPSQPNDLPVRSNSNNNNNNTGANSSSNNNNNNNNNSSSSSGSNPNAALYPWSQRRMLLTPAHPSPFPRYGAAVNAVSSKEGDVYLMGGLINGATVKGDLWMIEAGGNLACYPLTTTSEGPGPRVGHASLLVGNAFIVYGGDTKIDDNDILDETLYLLNTSTRHWSRALPAGPRPAGRYGHTLNILGSKIYIFGGQVDGYFMNDLSAFDLNQLQSPSNRWDILLNADVSPKVPAARTNHSMITYNDKMYLFGGTNGFQWFNDVWCYDPASNKWAQLDCIGYIPTPREGHAAALVDDVMYIFGGRTEDGTDLGDLAAFRITSRRWYTFQNMGPSPSPRSGHSMTTIGKTIAVIGGEPSTSSAAHNDLGLLYILDTTKIRYPNDSQPGHQRVPQGTRRPSGADSANPMSLGRQASRDGPNGPSDPRRMIGAPPGASNMMNGHGMTPAGADPHDIPNYGKSPGSPPPVTGPAKMGPGPHGNPGMGMAPGQAPGAPGSKLPRAATGASPPPQGPIPNKPTVFENASIGRVRGGSTDRAGNTGSPSLSIASSSNSINREVIQEVDTTATSTTASPVVNGRRTPTQIPKAGQTTQAAMPTDHQRTTSRSGQLPVTTDSAAETVQKSATPRSASPLSDTRRPANSVNRRSSARNSQTVALLKELDAARNRNAWYASELELARKAGYVPNASLGPALDSKAIETFDDEDRPLIEALLAMRTELANVQSSVDKQAIVASKQIAEAEKQRDAAIQEAVYAKAKLASQTPGSVASTPQVDGEQDEIDSRSIEMSKKLASALQTQKNLQTQLDAKKTEIEAERKARLLADDTSKASQKRMTDLETYRQQTSTEVERLKSELHLAQREAREQSVACAAAVASLELLKVEKEDLSGKYEEAVQVSREQEETFASLRSAIEASQESNSHLEAKLEEERSQRDVFENMFNTLKLEHEARTAELTNVTQRLRDAEELAESHAREAKTHRQAILSGLGKIATRDANRANPADAERVVALQNQVAAANASAKKYQQEADIAADKLRSAEERIAGLEQYQEQSSREGVTIRRQLQSALRETQGLQALNAEIKNQLAAQQLETNAMTVQHNALKDILSERGFSPTAIVRARSLANSRTNSPEMSRVRELETQLATVTAAHEEAKHTFAVQAQESEAAYREKLGQLENDYQSAVQYVKATEHVLKQLKEQLSKLKTENNRLKSEIDELDSKLDVDAHKSSLSDWEGERVALQEKITSLEYDLQTSNSQLEKNLASLRTELAEAYRQREDAVKNMEEALRHASNQRRELEQLQSENALLEQRAADAEQKVSLLLDQVEHSVDNYRRRSRHALNMGSDNAAGTNGSGGNTHSGGRNESLERESAYGPTSLDARDSMALDSLASELETLRSHWETTSKNYRLSTNFDFEGTGGKKDDDMPPLGLGLNESLANWSKRLDAEHSPDADVSK
ncbi:Tip elongation aberrant protein 1 [Escovopsis weberi]|uniref:Tip elongation aberrant protein 1 n=1 Tax=Escovopsis weberi TaxID=150374 RepID=A0A0M8MZC2_ESCWE|nr:Tip elongation aberrant protein 1 [Escovopsis weberi]